MQLGKCPQFGNDKMSQPSGHTDGGKQENNSKNAAAAVAKKSSRWKFINF